MPGKAEARLIYSSISTSERVNELGAKGMLLYILLIAHADGQGRLSGSSKAIKAMVAPLLDELTVDDIEQALDNMQRKDLVIRYLEQEGEIFAYSSPDEEGRPLIQIVDWWEWQDRLSIKTASHYPPPNQWEDRVTPRDERGRIRSAGQDTGR